MLCYGCLFVCLSVCFDLVLSRVVVVCSVVFMIWLFVCDLCYSVMFCIVSIYSLLFVYDMCVVYRILSPCVEMCCYVL